MLKSVPSFWQRLRNRHRYARAQAPSSRHRRAFLEPLEDRRVLAPGDLDLTFGGGDGIVTTYLDTSVAVAYSLAVDSAGNYVVAGLSNRGYLNNDFALTRFTPGGVLDPTFGGGDGFVTTAIGTGIDIAYSVAVDSAGNYVVAGSAVNNSGDRDFALARFTPAGVLDLTFGGGDGIVTTKIGEAEDFAYSLAVDNAGNYVVAGFSQIGHPADGTYALALVRYTPGGVLDTAFGGGDGIVTTSLGAANDFYYFEYRVAVAVDAAGNYVVAGFSSNGSNDDFALVRYTPDGALDLTFGGGDGIVTTAIGTSHDIGYSVAVDGAGNYIVAGQSWNGSSYDLALVRYAPGGVLDLTFGGGDGFVTTDIGPGRDLGRGLAIDQAGNYVVGGYSYNASANYDFLLARYTPAGVLDASFGGGDGIVTTGVGTSHDWGYGVAVDSAGSYLVAGGSAAMSGQVTSIALVRYEGPTLLPVVDGLGNLTVTDTWGAGKNNQLSISTVGGMLIIADAVEQFISAPSGWTLGAGNKSIRRPLAGFTGSITINGGLGSDTLTVDLSGGDVVPSGGITFNGDGSSTLPGDKLVIAGGAQGTVTYNYTSRNDGNIVMSNFGTVTYTSLKPIVNAGTSTDVIFNLPAAASAATLVDDGTVGNGISRFQLAAAIPELTDFASPTGSVTINRGNAADTMTVDWLFDLIADLTLGSAGSPLASVAFDGHQNLAAHKNLAAFASGTISLSDSSRLALRGTGQVLLSAARNISVSGNISFGSGITTVDGDIILSANQQVVATSAEFVGVRIGQNAFVETTGTGQIVISGRGGSGGQEKGVYVLGRISALGTGDIQVVGQGGTQSFNGSGIGIQGGRIETAQGNISLVGAGGGGDPGPYQFGEKGVEVIEGGMVRAGGAGNVAIQAVGGTGNGFNYGLLFKHLDSEISAVSGDISITAIPGPRVDIVAMHLNQNAQIRTSGGGQITVRGDRIAVASGASISVGSARVSIRPVTNNRPVLLGPTTDDADALELSDFELDAVTAGTLQIGDSTTGAITISSAITRSAATAMDLVSAAAITFNSSLTSAGGNVMLDPGTSVSPAASGLDVNVGAGTLTMGSGDDLLININGPAVDSQYQRLVVYGQVDLRGTDLVLSGTAPALASSFVIVNNDGTDPIVGTFNGLPEGAIINVNGVEKQITYMGGNGNDVELKVATLHVTAFALTTTGVVVTFNREFDVSTLNLYDVQGSPFGPADVTLVDANLRPVRGSVAIDPNLRRLTFIATTGRLPPNDYLLTLRSAANAFRDTSGGLLDASGIGLGVGDNVNVFFTVAADPANAVTISLPNFARGPQQAVNLPADSTTGIPVSFSNGGGITTANFELRYDPTLLTISAATVAPGLPAGATVNLNTSTPGVASVQFRSPTALAAGATRFVDLQASVPTTAVYRTKNVLDLTNIVLNGGAIPGIDDDALQVTAYFGDTTGNGGYSGSDATALQLLTTGTQTGAPGFRLLDPVIIGDLTGTSGISSSDASRALQLAAAVSLPEVPPIPMGVSLTQGGPDPKLSIPTDLVARPGQRVTIPVHIDSIVDLTGDGLESADLVLYYDATVLDVTSVSLGSLLTVDKQAGEWLIASRIDPQAGRIFVSLSSMQPLEGFFAGELVQLHGRVKADAQPGAMPINLAAGSRDPARFTQLNEGWLTLIPAPSDAADDVGVDGRLTILPAADVAPSGGHRADLIGSQLIISGTTSSDHVFVGLIGTDRVSVRVNNTILGQFLVPTQVTLASGAAATQLAISPELSIPRPTVPSAHDLALLQLLDVFQEDSRETTGVMRLRR